MAEPWVYGVCIHDIVVYVQPLCRIPILLELLLVKTIPSFPSEMLRTTSR